MCVALVASLTEEMAQHEVLLTTLMEQQTVTNSAVIHGLCTMTLNQQCIARSGSPPTMINHLTSRKYRLLEITSSELTRGSVQ